MVQVHLLFSILMTNTQFVPKPSVYLKELKLLSAREDSTVKIIAIRL